jgi:dynein intermediate chain 2
MPLYSYIWNLANPNFAEKTLAPPSALCTMVFNSKHQDVIAGGSYNGSLSFFDMRKGNSSVLKPTETTILELSHHEPVYDIYWLTVGKTGTECISTSTDGRLLFWDMRKLKDGPYDTLLLEDTYGEDSHKKILGGTSLEYNPEAGPLKYLVGSEQGYVIQCAKRKVLELTTKYGFESGKHHGPVYSL